MIRQLISWVMFVRAGFLASADKEQVLIGVAQGDILAELAGFPLIRSCGYRAGFL